MADRYDAIVVGAGPNGLAAAITLSRAGRSVLVVEARPTIGGGSRTAELTLPAFRHDVCSAIHPLGRASPVFGELPLERHGLAWIEPPVQLAHPLDDGAAAFVLRDLDATASTLGRDGRAYARLLGPVARDWEVITRRFLGPIDPLAGLRHPGVALRLGWRSIQPARRLARRFRTDAARVLLAGASAHSMLPLDALASGAFGVSLLASAHAVGWPMPAGGSQAIPDALAAHLAQLGGEIRTGLEIRSLNELPPHRAILFDLTPRQVLAIAGGRLRGAYAAQLRRYRYGPGSFKLDIALDGPIPWRNPRVGEAGTVHLGGRLEEIVPSERAVSRGRVPERPFVLLAQQSRFDASRAPEGKHTVWAYCHVPNSSPADMTEPILAQVERFAPGFRERILQVHAMGARELEAYNPNYVGGDINGGLQSLAQFFTRPAVRLDPVFDARSGPLHLLVVDPTGRRGARDLRLAGGTLGAPRGAALTAGPMRATVAILAAILLRPTARRPGHFARALLFYFGTAYRIRGERPAGSG